MSRQRNEVEPGRRANLKRIAGSIARREAELERLRAALVQEAGLAAGEGAGLLAIGEAAGLSKARAAQLVRAAAAVQAEQ